MADDIVTDLRIAGFDDSHPGDLLFKAADEIERLLADRDRWRAAAEAYDRGSQALGMTLTKEARRG